MVTLTMVQRSLYQWELISPNGKVMVTDIAFPNAYKAEEWVKSYISSYMNWTYKLKPLGDK